MAMAVPYLTSTSFLLSGVGVQDDGGAGVPQAQRRRRGERGRGGVVGDGGEELEEPPLAEAGEDGAAQPAVQPPERDPRQAGDHRGAQQGQVRARVVENVSSVNLPTPIQFRQGKVIIILLLFFVQLTSQWTGV